MSLSYCVIGNVSSIDFYKAHVYIDLTNEEKVFLGKKTNRIFGEAEGNDFAGFEAVLFLCSSLVMINC
jgi:hypothetical protein